MVISDPKITYDRTDDPCWIPCYLVQERLKPACSFIIVIIVIIVNIVKIVTNLRVPILTTIMVTWGALNMRVKESQGRSFCFCSS